MNSSLPTHFNNPNKLFGDYIMVISGIYQNVRSLRSKLNQLKQNGLVDNPDILCTTESWLNENIFDFVIVDSYNNNIFLRDRYTTKSEQTDGAGMMNAIKDQSNTESVP